MIPGYCYLESTRNKQSAQRKGRYVGEKNPMYGKRHTDKAKALMSKAKHGKVSGFLGKHLSDEAKCILSNKAKGRHARGNSVHAKPVICYETNQTYSCIREASIETGICEASISNACNGKYNTAGKYHWNFIKEEGIRFD